MRALARLSRRTLRLAGLALLGLAVAGVAWAAGGFTLDQGRPVAGGAASGGGYTLIGAAGQAEAGRLTGGGYAISGGVMHEEPTRTPTAVPSRTNTPPPGATLTFTPPPTNTPPPGATLIFTPPPTNTPPPGATLTPTPTATPILPDLVIGLAPVAGAAGASADTITARDGQALTRPAVEQPAAAATNINVTVTNRGAADTPADFWVDLHVDPGRTPRVNLTWDANCTNICLGVSWHITQTLHPGQSLTLSTAGGYDPDNTLWPGYVPVMAKSVAVMVDSFTDQGGWYGMVLESDETDNVAQMNLGAAPTAPPAAGGPTPLYLPFVMRGQP